MVADQVVAQGPAFPRLHRNQAKPRVFHVLVAPKVTLAGDVDRPGGFIEGDGLDPHEQVAGGPVHLQVDPLDTGQVRLEGVHQEIDILGEPCLGGLTGLDPGLADAQRSTQLSQSVCGEGGRDGLGDGAGQGRDLLDGA